jgi:hypothetical protein
VRIVTAGKKECPSCGELSESTAAWCDSCSQVLAKDPADPAPTPKPAEDPAQPPASETPSQQPPVRTPDASNEQAPATETKPCPYCAEEILAAANKCRHCGEFLNQAAARPAPPVAQPATPAASGGTGGAGLALGITALVFGVLAFVISWIPLLGLLGLPLSGLGVIFALIGLIIGMSSKRGSAIGFSVAGGAISAVALALAISSTFLAVGGAGQLTDAMDRGRQRRTMADMRNIATANGTLRVDTGRYAAKLEDLQTSGYMDVAPTADGWGTAWVYTTTGGSSYTISSLGSDGARGPSPPRVWTNEPYEPDIVMTDGQFVQAPTGR